MAGALVAGAIASGAAAGDSARGGWLEPTPGVSARGGSDAHVAVAPGGVAVALWSGVSGAPESVTKRGGEAWGPLSTLAYSFYARLALDRSGNALVTGVQPAGTNSRVVAFMRAAASAQWTGPVAVSGPERDPAAPDLAANESGQAVAAWRAGDSPLPVVRAAVRGVDGTWAAPENLGYAGSSGPWVAIDGRGNAVALWTRGPSSGDADVYVESRPAGSGWERAVVLSRRGLDYGNGRVITNRRGDALAVWGEADGSGSVSLVSSLRHAGESDWGPPSRVPISNPAIAVHAYGGFSVALDEAGTATLVEQTADGRIEVVTRGADSAGWTGPVVIGNGGGGDAWYARDTWCLDPQIALDATGGAVVIWGGAALYASIRRSRSSAWEPPVTIAPGPVCFARALAVDPAGNAVALWNASGSAVTRLDAAILDATPPVLGRLAVPRDPRAGRRLRFSVTASDEWSSLARPPLWRFGDGASLRGTVVRHAYRRPGRYLVTVTATDRAGNEATSTARIRVRRGH